MGANSLIQCEPSPLSTAGWRLEMMWIVLEVVGRGVGGADV